MTQLDLVNLWHAINTRQRRPTMSDWRELARATFDLPRDEMLRELEAINEMAIREGLLTPEHVGPTLDRMGRPRKQ